MSISGFQISCVLSLWKRAQKLCSSFLTERIYFFLPKTIFSIISIVVFWRLSFFHRFFHRLIEVCLLQRYFLRQNIRNHIAAGDGDLQSKEMAQNEDDSLHQYSKFAQQFCACFSSHNKIVSCQWTKESDAKMGLIFLLMTTFLQAEHIIVNSRSVRWSTKLSEIISR